MLVKGKYHCDNIVAIKDGPLDPPLFATYYDATKVYYQIAAYSGDTAYWNVCADTARYVYADRYAIPGDYNVPGYWNFTRGLLTDFELTGRQSSKDTVIGLSEHMYGLPTTPLDYTKSFGNMRENAYAIMAFVNAEKLGTPRREKRQQLVDQAYSHWPQLLDRAQWGTVDAQPFMAGLSAYALIMDWEQTKDARLLPAIRLLADWLWTNAWHEESQGMKYNLNPVSGEGLSLVGSPDLNMLIAPMYAFLWEQTGEVKYREQGDKLFAGAARFAWLDGPKQFNQSYVYSFDYVKRRGFPIVK
jgi:hypothetical protein